MNEHEQPKPINQNPNDINNNQNDCFYSQTSNQLHQDNIQEFKNQQSLSCGYTINSLPTTETTDPFKNINEKLNLVYMSDSENEMDYEIEHDQINKMYNEEGDDYNNYLPTKNEKMEYDEPAVNPINSNSKLTLLGTVESHFDGLILIKRSCNKVKVVNLDTTCYNKVFNPIGFIIDIIGQIDDPIYLIKSFSTTSDNFNNMQPEDLVFFDENKTQFVDTEELKMKTKHTDASNAFDEEISQEEYSDDEKEKNKKKYKEDKHSNKVDYFNQQPLGLKPNQIDPFSMFTNK